jgi:hypothetical protein
MAFIMWGIYPWIKSTRSYFQCRRQCFWERWFCQLLSWTSGTSYTVNGTSELLSVPYALHAKSSGDWKNNGNDVSNANTGNVGIGTNTPDYKLTVVDNSSSGLLKLKSTDSSTQITMDDSGLDDVYLTSTQGDFDIWTGGNNKRLSVRSNGNVGIGTSVPDFPLSFPTTYGDKISLWGNTSNRVGFAVQPANFQMLGDVSSTDLTFGYGLSGAPTELMRIKGNTGNVGIGTTSPSAKLQVASTFSNVAIFDGDNSMFVTLAENGVNRGYIGSYSGNTEDVELGTYNTNTTGAVHLTTANFPRITAINNGNVGVGTTTPATKLEVNGGTKLGNNAPAIKMLKLTGTSDVNQGGQVAVPHGLNSAKILAVNILMEYGGGPANTVPPAYTVNSGYEYSYYVTASNINIWNKAANSLNILSQPFTILVTYEE